jgi:general secretion pathway protein G
MLVLAIIGVLTAIAAVSIGGSSKKAKIRATFASMEVIRHALDLYKLDKNVYPADLTALQAGSTPYLDKNKPLADGWQHPFLYQTPGSNGHDYDLYSMGDNGVFESGGGDDLDVWRPNAEQP